MVSPKWLWMLGCGMLIMTGCVALPEPEVDIVVPTVPPSVASATLTATLVVATPLSTPTTAPTVTVTPTPEESEPSPVAEAQAYIRDELLSPDGQWKVTTAYTRMNGNFPLEVEFTLTNIATGAETLIESRVVADGRPFVEQVPVPLAWRADSQALYYTDEPGYIDGCWTGARSPLHQYILADHGQETLSTPAGSWHRFSPNSQQVAYFPIRPADAPPALALYTPATDTLHEIPFPQFHPILAFVQELTGQMLWSADGQQVVLSVLLAPCLDSVPALLLVDVATLELTVLEVGTHYYRLLGWEEGMVVLSDENGTTRRLDVERSAPLTPTATPMATPEISFAIPLPSPNGAWLATVYLDALPAPNEILFTITDQTTEAQTIVERLTAGQDAPIPSAPRLLTWGGEGGNTLYYTRGPVYGDGCGSLFRTPLFQYDATTESSQRLNIPEGDFFTFSPDTTQVVYLPTDSSTDPATFAIYDLSQNQLQQVEFDSVLVPFRADEVMAQFVWHPTRPLIALVVTVNTCIGAGSDRFILLDTDTMTSTLVELDSPYTFKIEGWEGDNILVLYSDANGEPHLRYDIDTGAWQ